MKLKGISVCFSMLKAALCGSYVNFGVFRLYGDEALDNALNVFVKLLLSIPQSDLLVSFNSSKFPTGITTKFCCAGLSKTVADLLRAARMSRAGSHEFFGHLRAPSVPLHSVLNLRRTDSLRWAL